MGQRQIGGVIVVLASLVGLLPVRPAAFNEAVPQSLDALQPAQTWPPPNTSRPGAGITMPKVVREVKPKYTVEAMREKIQATLGNGSTGRAVVTDPIEYSRRYHQSHDGYADHVRSGRDFRAFMALVRSGGQIGLECTDRNTLGRSPEGDVRWNPRLGLRYHG